jgi:hypothetical protein
MRLAIASLFAATTLLTAACSSGVSPGSPEWCKDTPVEKQVEDPTAMAKCMDAPTS